MLGDLYQKQNRIAEAASLYDQQLAMKELQPEYRQELQRRQAALPRL